jgi:DNA-binding response OmpR family regulator
VTAEPRKRVLIAEDDPAIAQLVQRVLSQRYEVILATDGRAAVAAASAQENLALIILDVMMPGLDGHAVAHAVRNIPALKTVPIIFLTAKDRPADVIKGIQSGARHYVTKPFKIDDLLSKVKKVLGE